jgi:hypothetical protein
MRGEMGRSDRVREGGRDCHLPEYLDFPLVKCAWKEDRTVIINNLVDSLKSL